MRYYCHNIYEKEMDRKKILVYSIVDRESPRIFDLTESEAVKFLKKHQIRNLNLLNGKIVTSNMDFLTNPEVKDNIFRLLEAASQEFWNRNRTKLMINNVLSDIHLHSMAYGWCVPHNFMYTYAPIYINRGQGIQLFLGFIFHLDNLSYSGIIDAHPHNNWNDVDEPSWDEFTSAKKFRSTRKYKNIETAIKRLSENLEYVDIRNIKNVCNNIEFG